MARPIHELIAAVFAGDPVTSTEAARLTRHMRHVEQIDDWMMRDVTPADRARSEAAGIGSEYKTYRSMVLSDLRKYTVAQLRDLVRRQLLLLGVFVELYAAENGRARRQHKQRQRGARHTTAARRLEAEALLSAIAGVKARHARPLSDRSAARLHLSETDKVWLAGTDAERERKLVALERRIRRARKNTGHSLS